MSKQTPNSQRDRDRQRYAPQPARVPEPVFDHPDRFRKVSERMPDPMPLPEPPAPDLRPSLNPWERRILIELILVIGTVAIYVLKGRS